MPKPAVLMARDERSDLLDFLRTLTPEQWNAPSLCRGWSVKDVAAHMISYDDLGIVGMTKRLVKGRLIWLTRQELRSTAICRRPNCLRRSNSASRQRA